MFFESASRLEQQGLQEAARCLDRPSSRDRGFAWACSVLCDFYQDHIKTSKPKCETRSEKNAGGGAAYDDVVLVVVLLTTTWTVVAVVGGAGGGAAAYDDGRVDVITPPPRHPPHEM